MRLHIRLALASLITGYISVGWGGPQRLADAGSWALQPIQKPIPPSVTSMDWPNGPIDAFVAANQSAEGLSPSPEAGRRVLARRVSFDLIGLPPGPIQVDALAADQRPDAYERLVDRLLASPQFGERMTQHWLDVARYADSDGYHDDTNRSMWPYRDWVIRAFNENKPFDKFTVEQLAGDLLPDATRDQRLATAFHRNGPTSSEDGANPAEYLIRYAVDRVNTTAAVWLGMTFECAQCHDHKYDPLTMREYYQFLAFFNQTPERPLYRGIYAPPAIELPTEEQSFELDRLRAVIQSKKARLRKKERQVALDQQAWEDSFQRIPPTKIDREGLVAEFLFDGGGELHLANTGARRQPARIRRAPGEDDPREAQGLIGNALEFTGAGGVAELGQLVEFRRDAGFTFGAWVKYRKRGGCIVSKVDPKLEMRGLDVCAEDRRIVVRLIHQWPGAAIQVTTTAQYPVDRWLHLAVTYDGSSDPHGIYVYFNGQSQELAVNRHTDLVGQLRNRAALLIGGGPGDASFQGLIDDVQFYKWPMNNQELAAELFRVIRRIGALPRGARSADQMAFIDSFYRERVNPATTSLRREIAEAENAEKKLTESIQKIRVMADAPERRDTHVLLRGDFRQPGPKVRPDTPAFLPPLSRVLQPGTEYSRLDLANWLIDPKHPLTARVTANRFWGLMFGRAIVATPDDFGVRGQVPSHPQLLDWLALEFVHGGWNVKALLRRFVTSSTYRQVSSAPAELRALDPENRLLCRGVRHRLPAETLRDNVLKISGLLSDQIGGPSVRPYQPSGLWREMAKGDDEIKTYVQSRGPDLYRRGLYTFWKRSIHYPAFALLDAPNRETCTIDRPITNTPLQALVTLNEPSFVEAARVFAARILRDSSPPFDKRLHVAFGRALARPPSSGETDTLFAVYEEMSEWFEQDAEAARQLTQNGDFPVDETTESVELAVWTAIAQIILNLDETLTRE